MWVLTALLPYSSPIPKHCVVKGTCVLPWHFLLVKPSPVNARGMHFLLFLLPTETHPAATHTTVTSTAPVHHNTYDGINTVRLRYRLTELGSIIMGRRKKSKANRRPLMASQERPGQRGEDDIAVLDECGDANLPSLYDGDDLPSEDVMPESEVKLLVEFVLEACEDCSGKWITKHMPVTTRALKAGIFPGGKFMVKFKKSFDEIAWKKEMAGCESRSHIPVEPNSRNVVFFDARAIAQKAVPIRLARQAGCPLAVYARNLRLFETALFELAQKYESRYLEDGEPGLPRWEHVFKLAFDTTCFHFGPEGDTAFFRGKDGMFNRKCFLYNKPESVFSVFVNDKNRAALRMQRQCIFNHLMRVVGAVTEGSDQAHKICWQCSKKSPTLRQCSCCHVAQYCGKDCQLIAWKQGGHKDKCVDMAKQHECFEKSLAILSAAHDAEIEQNAWPCFVLDFRALLYCLCPDSNPWEGTMFEVAFSAPSVESYFDNLGRIRDGEFWFFPRSMDLVEYEKQVCGERGLEHNEMIFHELLEELLSFDYYGYLDQQGLPRSAFEEMFAFSNCSKFVQVCDINGIGMPASRFLTIHDDARILNSEKITADLDAFRRKKNDEILKKFVQLLYKESKNRSGAP